MKAIFLDRDGVLNVEKGRYVYKIEDFQVVPGIIDVLQRLKQKGFVLIVVTNQAGIAKGKYTEGDMDACHAYFQRESGNLIDDFYFAPDHPDYSESLSRKPGSLLFEKAIARYNVEVANSWMIGNSERDLIPAKKLGITTIMFQGPASAYADYQVAEVAEITNLII
jgi:D-glycero-D-manno-heptose 1,7-bisphosphate phosphatase